MKSMDVVLGSNKEFVSPSHDLIAQGAAQHTNVQS